ncbi:MAG TPA: DUF1028 domain-containing protein [Candidatus Krumholzibacteria bacterium]|nr:DUF1028 domain-containing protein [Candidatus Krumholzibacteria bacterium]
MRRIVLALLLVLTSVSLFVTPARATYSIVARDPDTGQLGVAVQSHWFSVGALVPWAQAGVGAVATQSLVDPTYGPLGLDLMRAGRSASQSLEGLLVADAHPEIRQVAMIDADGNVAAHTGTNCIPHAGHVTGENFSVQANLMDRETVPQAMASAFRSTDGDLAARMLAALQAAQDEGGDIRGEQSAALLVVSGTPTGRPWADVVVDLRVEDHDDPVGELTRLLEVHRGYEKMNEGDLALERGDVDAAQQAYGEAQTVLGDNLEASFWFAVALANAGEDDRAIAMFHRIFEQGENWRRLTPRLVEGGFLQVDEEMLERIVGE